MPHTILLVDDDPNVLTGLRRGLHREPYRVVTAENAAIAFKVLRTQVVDLVVSDEQMPGLPGTEFLGRVQAEFPDVVRIILTGRASLDLAIRAINQGQVFRFLTKPCNPVDLAAAIRQGLQHKDLLLSSRRLLQAVRRQSVVLDEVHGLPQDDARSGSPRSYEVPLADVPTDLDRLLQEVETELEATDARLREREREIRQRGEEMLRERARTTVR